MRANKTQETDADVSRYLAAIEDPGRRADCQALAELMSRVTGRPARMWGPGIVGFGVHRYRYESGREGEICAVGFASRKGEIVLYGLDIADEPGTLAGKLGKFKTGKSCLYIKRLADVDLTVLSDMVQVVARNRLANDA
ncbi:DUF1801 domain-containing protein [Luteimonas kalidii]|uniref:DUF1801 domain-containing protein n=1 Tax=Luteimonas kalidii TaxID=3042025 RepID=A0ABT6JTN8_9GAMM|nr:DUF1801 domain-containing protein [Luteimonas kalidii]MDH5833506.1 DUF1801 domain-containing protein [Luteimonas kalidii]